jgi:hypothetical protein
MPAGAVDLGVIDRRDMAAVPESAGSDLDE